MGWTATAPFRPIAGTGQSLSLTSGTAATFTNKMGLQTHAFVFKFSPGTTAYIGTLAISQAGTAATASTDYPVASTDIPVIVGCAPGDKVSVYQASGSTQTAYLCELTV